MYHLYEWRKGTRIRWHRVLSVASKGDVDDSDGPQHRDIRGDANIWFCKVRNAKETSFKYTIFCTYFAFGIWFNQLSQNKGGWNFQTCPLYNDLQCSAWEVQRLAFGLQSSHTRVLQWVYHCNIGALRKWLLDPSKVPEPALGPSRWEPEDLAMLALDILGLAHFVSDNTAWEYEPCTPLCPGVGTSDTRYSGKS